MSVWELPGMPMASYGAALPFREPPAIPARLYYGERDDPIKGPSPRGRPQACNHKSTPVIIEPADHDRVRARCLRCGTYGPVRDSAGEAREALEKDA